MGRVTRKLRTRRIFWKLMLNYGVRVWLLQYRLCTSTHMFSDIIHIPDTSPTKGDVALVKALNGTVLRKVTDDPPSGRKSAKKGSVDARKLLLLG